LEAPPPKIFLLPLCWLSLSLAQCSSSIVTTTVSSFGQTETQQRPIETARPHSRPRKLHQEDGACLASVCGRPPTVRVRMDIHLPARNRQRTSLGSLGGFRQHGRRDCLPCVLPDNLTPSEFPTMPAKNIVVPWRGAWPPKGRERTGREASILAHINLNYSAHFMLEPKTRGGQ
jgi:hypothetical protein